MKLHCIVIVVPISPPANIYRKRFTIQNVSMEVKFQIETDTDHVGFLLLDKMSQNHGISV